MTSPATEELDAFSTSVAAVLAREAPRTAVQKFIENSSDLPARLWSRAVELGWPGIAEAEAFDGRVAAGLDVLHRRLGEFLTPGPYLANLALAGAADSELFETLAQNTPGVATPLQLVGRGGDMAASSLVLGPAEASHVLRASGDGWTIVRLEQPAHRAIRMWDATRDVAEPATKIGGEIVQTLDEAAQRRFLGLYLLSVASDSVGGARQILGQTVEYMKTRRQFGRPIGSFQALKHRVADMEKALRLNEELVAHAADRIDEGAPDAEFWALCAKADATDGYARIAGECVQLHGGMGFTEALDCHLFLKRARLNQVLVGSNPHLRDRAARLYAEAALARRSLMELVL